nr:MAG TPA: hypothetical protein [Podoviridae sp. ctY3D12]
MEFHYFESIIINTKFRYSLIDILSTSSNWFSLFINILGSTY